MRVALFLNVDRIARTTARERVSSNNREPPTAGRKRDTLPAPRDNLVPPQGEHLENPEYVSTHRR